MKINLANLNLNKYLVFFLLGIILLLGGFARFYKLDSLPPSITWDEAAVGYNAWTIANWGMDEWGKILPAYFKSFLDFKSPVHIYVTALFVKIFGLSDFSIRLPAALLGLANILLIFVVSKQIFRSKLAAFFAAFCLSVSTYSIHFSRFNHEFNFVMFFFLLGLLLFFTGLEKKNILLPLSFFSLMLSLISYPSAKIVIPPFLFILFLLYWSKIKESFKLFLLSIIVVLPFIFLIVLNPQLIGLDRAKQTVFAESDIRNTPLYMSTNNFALGQLNFIFDKYIQHFSYNYLFVSGDKNSRLSVQSRGEFFIFDILFIFAGLIAFLLKRKKEVILVITLLILAPVPSSLTTESPHASRAMFMLVSWYLLVGFGFSNLINFIRNRYVNLMIICSTVVVYLFLFKDINFIYEEYSKRYAIQWQYGMKQIVEYVKQNPKYKQVYMTNVRSQPYIFFLYYLQFPLPEYLKTVEYNTSDSRSYNLVSRFDRFNFEYWDPIESMPANDILYIIAPNHYDGLRYKQSFIVKEKIYYPNGTDAFFIISGI